MAEQTIRETQITTSDITSNDVSTSKHGFTPKAPNDATKYLDGTGAWTVPAGSGGGTNEHPSLTAPATVAGGSWAWINQGGASVADVSGGITLTMTSGSGDNVRLYKRSAPSAPYTLTMACFINFIATNFFECGFFHRSSGDGKLTFFGLAHNTFGVNFGLYAVTHASPTGSGTGVASKAITFPFPLEVGGLIWLRIQDNNTNRIYDYSQDGRNWTNLYTVSRTTHHTPDEIGIGINPNNATAGGFITLVSWVAA